MELNDILSNAADQEAGTWFDLEDPVTLRPSGMRLKIAGPDSEIQHKARLKMADELADVADAYGRVRAGDREAVRLATLARCVLAWEVTEGGESLPCTHANVLRLLKAAHWVQVQVDGFAADRSAHGGES